MCFGFQRFEYKNHKSSGYCKVEEETKVGLQSLGCALHYKTLIAKSTKQQVTEKKRKRQITTLFITVFNVPLRYLNWERADSITFAVLDVFLLFFFRKRNIHSMESYLKMMAVHSTGFIDPSSIYYLYLC